MADIDGEASLLALVQAGKKQMQEDPQYEGVAGFPLASLWVWVRGLVRGLVWGMVQGFVRGLDRRLVLVWVLNLVWGWVRDWVQGLASDSGSG